MKQIYAPFLFLVLVSCFDSTQNKPNLQFHSSQCKRPLGNKLNSCQLFDPHQDPKTGDKLLVDSDNKYDMPLGSRIGMNRLQSSYTRLHIHKNHPSGVSLFSTDGGLAGLLDSFLTSIEQDPYFLIYFSKIHLLVLHEIYQYLMSIYVTFNMTHVQTVQQHLVNQTTQALNKKTVIINHLFNLIEAQANKAILMRFPNIPEHLATRMGKMMMKYDYGADLDLMMEKQEEILFAHYFNDPEIANNPAEHETTKNIKDHFKKRRELYTTLFGNYLRFFKGYTAALEQEDPLHGSAFVKHAQKIQKIIEAQSSHYTALKKQLKGAKIKTKVQTLKKIKTINPPLFFYNATTFRGMKLIPRIAKDLPKQSENVPWPKKLVEDATTKNPIKNKWGQIISNQSAAYFETSGGKQTTNQAEAVALYVNIPTVQNMYTQEVITQPDWLNSYEGVMMMLRACLGDFTALFSQELKNEFIIDPCLSCIIVKAAQKVGVELAGINVKEICSTCQTYLTSLQKLLGWQKPGETGDKLPSEENGNGLPPNGDNGGRDNDEDNGMPGTGGLS